MTEATAVTVMVGLIGGGLSWGAVMTMAEGRYLKVRRLRRAEQLRHSVELKKERRKYDLLIELTAHHAALINDIVFWGRQLRDDNPVVVQVAGSMLDYLLEEDQLNQGDTADAAHGSAHQLHREQPRPAPGADHHELPTGSERGRDHPDGGVDCRCAECHHLLRNAQRKLRGVPLHQRS